MKPLILCIFIVSFVFSCGKDDEPRNNNPNLTDPIVNISLNLNLPQYDPLKFPGNSIILNGEGIRGIVVYNVNNDLYTALELSDPNHPPNDCSRMNVEVPVASCPCGSDTNEYFITDGQHSSDNTLFPMQAYRIVRTGDQIRITN